MSPEKLAVLDKMILWIELISGKFISFKLHFHTTAAMISWAVFCNLGEHGNY
jgi:hypothetical protein